jgi:hypothetical protein
MQTTTTPPPVAAPATTVKRRLLKYGTAFALVVLATAIAYYFITGWMYERERERVIAEMDAEDPNWRWHDLVAELKPPPDDENSAVHVLKVAKLLKAAPFRPGAVWEGESVEKALLVRNARLAPEHAKILRDAFVKLDPTFLAEGRKLKDMPNGRFHIPADVDNVFRMSLDWVQSTREVINVLHHDAMLRSQDDIEGSAESCLAMIHVAHSINDHPFLISQLVRVAEHAIIMAALERLLGQGTLKEETLAKVQAALEREAAANTFHLGLRGERAGAQHFFSAVREGKTNVSSILGGPGGPDLGERLVDAFPALILRGEAEHLRIMNEMVKAAKLEAPERLAALDKIENQVRKSSAWSVRLLVPAVSKLAQASQRVQAQARCAVVAVAAERYRLKYDAFPANLKDVVSAGLLKEVPLDPYDGQPLRWVKTPSGGGIVYSIGYDKIDNGGKIDRAANPMNKGLDSGFELWPLSQRGIAPPVIEENPD